MIAPPSASAQSSGSSGRRCSLAATAGVWISSHELAKVPRHMNHAARDRRPLSPAVTPALARVNVASAIARP